MTTRLARAGGLGLAGSVAAGLVFGVLTGLTRMGWSVGTPPAVPSHGPLFALGFLGTVIGLERAVALRRRWAWIVPVASAAAVLTILAGAPAVIPGGLLGVGGLGLTAVFVTAQRVQPGLHILVMAAGAASWVVGAAGLLADVSVPQLVPAMAGFLVLTIYGERLELARLGGVSEGSRRCLVVTCLAVATGAVVALFDAGVGGWISGAGFLSAAAWLARNDVARRTVRIPGLTRYMATALLIGYGWLATAGAIWVAGGLAPGTLTYDAAVHSVFLGFVFSMVFAHAPIIVPAITGQAVPYHRWFWAPLIALHATLAFRVAGDLMGASDVRRWGGMGNSLTIALFLVVLVIAVARGRRPT